MNRYSLPPNAGVHIGAYTRVQPAEIVYCEGDRNYTHVHFARRPKLTLSVTLRILHERLGGHHFLRINRSILVNKACIVRYDECRVILSNGMVLSIARRRRREVIRLLGTP